MEFPWADILNTGGVFGIAVVLLWLLVDAYKQNDKLRQTLADLTQAVVVKFEAEAGLINNACARFDNGLEKVEEALRVHDARVNDLVVSGLKDNRTKIESVERKIGRLLGKASKDQGEDVD